MRSCKIFIGAVLALAALATGCNGPKSDCEGTMNSFASIVDGDSWDDLPDLIMPSQRTKFSDDAIASWIASEYEGCRSFKFNALQPSVSGDQCFAASSATWTQKIRGKNPVTFDDVEFTYTLHLINGKWYLEMPGTAKIHAY